jgi:hypothetical protein
MNHPVVYEVTIREAGDVRTEILTSQMILHIPMFQPSWLALWPWPLSLLLA